MRQHQLVLKNQNNLQLFQQINTKDKFMLFLKVTWFEGMIGFYNHKYL